MTLEYNGNLTCSMQCTSLDRTIDWCAKTLGFKLLYRVDEIAWCEMATPTSGATVGYSQVETPEVKGGATLVWGVKDIDEARKKLEDMKVRFDGETLTFPGMVRLATFFDPDGNKFMLSQELSGQH